MQADHSPPVCRRSGKFGSTGRLAVQTSEFNPKKNVCECVCVCVVTDA